MAPEVFTHRRYSEKSDVFSFGICLYEMLTQRRPYEELNLKQTKKNYKPLVSTAECAVGAGELTLGSFGWVRQYAAGSRAYQQYLVPNIRERNDPLMLRLRAMVEDCTAWDPKERPLYVLAAWGEAAAVSVV